MTPILAAATAIVAVRAALGFQFPVPWPDETGFVAPAFDFARTGSFFDPGMNPDRVVMWMPPGYMVVLALVFRLFGYGFSLARWVSALFCLLSLGLAAALALRLTEGSRRVLACWSVGLAFLTPYALIDANIARMETLFCCVMMLALTALVAGRPYVAAALMAAGGVVHFNAGYFVPVMLLDVALRLRSGRLGKPLRIDGAAMLAATVVVGLYGGHVLHNWQGFTADMGFQFDLKRFYGQHDAAHPLWIVLAGGALAAVVAWTRRACDGATLTALFGVAFLAMAHGGHEIWYDYGQPLGFALIAIGALARPNMSQPMPARAAWVGPIAAVLVVAVGLRITPAMAALRPRLAMLRRDLLAPGEIGKVRAFIATLRPGETVDFGWSGLEPFFLNDLARVGARWTIIRHSVTETRPLRPADWRVVCDSSEWPRLSFQFDIDHPRHGVDRACEIISATDTRGGP